MACLSKDYLRSCKYGKLKSYMSIKQAEHKHKHNLINSFCNNGHFYIKQHENNRTSVKNRSRETERERMLLPVTVWYCIACHRLVYIAPNSTKQRPWWKTQLLMYTNLRVLRYSHAHMTWIIILTRALREREREREILKYVAVLIITIWKDFN